MKFHQILVGAAVFLAACSSPKKYTYYFDHYDYQSVKKTNEVVGKVEEESTPSVINREETIADASNQPVVTNGNKKVATSLSSTTASSEAQLVKKYKEMSKSERKTFRKALKNELVTYSKKSKKGEGVESIGATKEFDTLAALAIVFGGAGIVMIMLAGISNVFWVLGAISLVIGAFLFYRWVANGNG